MTSWKRVKGPNGRLQAFGFCDYADAESALRAIRLLHDYEIAEKKLVVKVDAKTKEKLDNYAKESESKASDESKPTEEESNEEDEKVMELVKNLVKDAEAHIKSKKSEAQSNESSANEPTVIQPPSQPKNQIPAEPNLQSFSDMDIEDEKKTLIHREIGKFRSTYKKQDEEKEKLEAERARERELRKERDRRDRDRERNRLSPSRDRKLEPLSNRYDRESSGRYDSRPERALDRPDRNNDYRSLDRGDRDRNERDRNERDRNERDRNERDRNERDRIDRDRIDRDRIDRDRNDRERELSRSNYEDDETIELRRQQREERKKEQSYQKRLKDWEIREERKRRQYEKDKYRSIEKKKEEEKELLNLKQFLEDYNDDLDDVKYYKGNNFVRKLKEFEKEREEDERDRISEKKELEELRKKLADEGHPDPESEAKKLMSNSGDEKLLAVDKSAANELNNGNHQRATEQSNEAASQNNAEEIHVKSFSLTKQDHRHLKSQANNESNFDTHITPVSDFPNNSNHTTAAATTTTANEKKKKSLSMQEVFNANEEDEKSQTSKKRKLPVFIDDNTDSNQSLTSNNKNSNDSKSLSTDDKRKQIKAVIDSIPTTKEELFKYEIEWDFVDSNLMEKRIRPWINKKITEYIGEEEKALLDFICGKLNARCNAQSILDDVAMVLDDEAEVFIVKMLRLLIYEIEAKKLGLGGK